MSDLQKMRSTWRPRLAHTVVWMVRLILPIDAALVYFRPEAGDTVVALTVAVLTFAASLFGIRQWGKNNGAE